MSSEKDERESQRPSEAGGKRKRVRSPEPQGAFDAGEQDEAKEQPEYEAGAFGLFEKECQGSERSCPERPWRLPRLRQQNRTIDRKTQPQRAVPIVQDDKPPRERRH